MPARRTLSDLTRDLNTTRGTVKRLRQECNEVQEGFDTLKEKYQKLKKAYNSELL